MIMTKEQIQTWIKENGNADTEILNWLGDILQDMVVEQVKLDEELEEMIADHETKEAITKGYITL